MRREYAPASSPASFSYGGGFCKGLVRSTFSKAWVLVFRPVADKLFASLAAALLNASAQVPTLPVKLRLFNKLAARRVHALQN